MSRKNYHKEAIALLGKPEALDPVKIMWWISRHHPSVFYWAAKRTQVDTDAINAELLSHIRAGTPLDAIKRYRELVPGTSLLEAKNHVDSLMAEAQR